MNLPDAIRGLSQRFSVSPRPIRRSSPGPARSRPPQRGSRGQSLAEFALILPVFFAIVLVGLDFGRVFLGWVNLNNAARVAANYAAQNPNAWNVGNPNVAAQAEYQRLVRNDADRINCTLPSAIPTPSFPSGRGIGSPANVTIPCSFQLLTPVISSIIGNPLPVTAKAAFPIRAGTIAGIPVATAAPTPTPTASPSSSPSGSPDPSASASASPTPTPIPTCTVPNLVGVNTKFAQDIWGSKGHGQTPGAGFTTNVIFNPLIGGPNSDYTIASQTPAPGASLPCGTTSITVRS